jgi:hypothetical protein
VVSDYRRIAEALFEDRHGQPLSDWIADQKDAGLTWRAIARQLRDLTGGLLDVAPQTLINWQADHREPAA